MTPDGTIITDEASTTVTYIGYALNAAANQSEAVWAIQKITATNASSPQGVTLFQWAINENVYGNVWVNRTGLTYR